MIILSLIPVSFELEVNSLSILGFSKVEVGLFSSATFPDWLVLQVLIVSCCCCFSFFSGGMACNRNDSISAVQVCSKLPIVCSYCRETHGVRAMTNPRTTMLPAANPCTNLCMLSASEFVHCNSGHDCRLKLNIRNFEVF